MQVGIEHKTLLFGKFQELITLLSVQGLRWIMTGAARNIGITLLACVY